MKRVFVLVGVMLVLGGCALGKTPIPNADSAEAKLFAQKCSKCHALPHPKRNTSEEWSHLVALMEQRMDERGVEGLTDEERNMVLGYLNANAR